MVFQDYTLFPHLTAIENIGSPRTGRPDVEAEAEA